MNTDREVEQIVEDWLEDRVAEPRPEGLREVLEQVPATPQGRPRFSGWRFGAGDRQRRLGVAAGAVATVAVLLLGVGVVTTQDGQPEIGAGRTLAVNADGSADFIAIADAVEASADGDTILVKPGIYTETMVTIDKGVAILGDGPADSVIIQAEDDASKWPVGRTCGTGESPYADVLEQELSACAFIIDHADARLSGLTFRGPWAGIDVLGGAPELSGLRFVGVGATFGQDIDAMERGEAGLTRASADSTFSDAGLPVALMDESRAIVRDSEFIATASLGIFGRSAPIIEGNVMVEGANIWGFDAGDETIISGNTISDTLANAIVIDQPSTLLIEHNSISAAGRNGIEVGTGGVSPGVDPVIRGNTIVGSLGTAINLADDTLPTIEGNTLIDNRLGISVFRTDPTVSDNVLTGNRTGIMVTAAAPLLEGNSVTGGRVGLMLTGAETDVTLAGNTVCDNETDLQVVGGTMPDTEGNDICS